jgi:hypothetical protein
MSNRFTWGPSTVLICMALLSAAARSQSVNKQTDIDRTISVGQPKIWRYERVYPLLDGMLRDIEAALIQHLPLMDPNQANQTYIDFLRTLIGVQADYNQGVGVKNQLELSKAQQTAAQRQLDSQYHDALRRERMNTEDQLIAAEQQLTQAQHQVAAAKVGSSEQTDAQKEVDRQTQIVGDLQTRKKQLDTDIGASDNGTPTFTDAMAGDLAKTQPSTLPQFLDTVPDNIKAKLWENIGKSDLPVSKQFDNYVTLLNERLAKQLMVIADDASRNQYELFMMQFDVGLYPSGKTKNRVARVEFQLAADSSIHKLPYAYGLIPGTSAYNIQEYIGRSQNVNFIGLFNLLSGLGIRGEYQRQRDQFRSGLIQTVYTSGFENGTTSFGWFHGPAPFEAFVTPGLRTTYALVAVPYCTPKISFTIHKGWQSKNGVLLRDTKSADATYEVDVPTYNPTCSSGGRQDTSFGLSVTRIAYQTKPNPAQALTPKLNNSLGDTSSDDTNTIAITLKNPADANLTITGGGKLLKRVRDSRGQAVLTCVQSSNQPNNVPNNSTNSNPAPAAGTTTTACNNGLIPPRGEFEVDKFERDTWILSNSKTLLLNISKSTAGSAFPVVRLSDSSSEAVDITSLLAPTAEVEIDNWKFHAPTPRSAFLPLFLPPPCRVEQLLNVSLDELGSPDKVRVAFHPSDTDPAVPDCAKKHLLTEDTQVTLDIGGGVGQWALNCKLSGDLICEIPSKACPEAQPHCIADQSLAVYEPRSGIAASSRFLSSDVLPHTDATYQSVTYGAAEHVWRVAVYAIHLSLADTRIRELTSCNEPTTVIPHPADNYLEVFISPQAYATCIDHDSSQAFHLLHHANRSKPLFGASGATELGDVPVEIVNIGWAIRTTTSQGLKISKWTGSHFSLKDPNGGLWFHPEAIDSLTATNGVDADVKLNIRHVPGALIFEATDKMLSSSTGYYLRLGVASAFFDLEENGGSPQCFNFKSGDGHCGDN